MDEFCEIWRKRSQLKSWKRSVRVRLRVFFHLQACAFDGNVIEPLACLRLHTIKCHPVFNWLAELCKKCYSLMEFICSCQLLVVDVCIACRH